MPFDWTEYLNLARRLAQPGASEAESRSAISRAYYAVFCTARNQLTSGGVHIAKDAQAHESVWNEYRNAAGNVQNNIGLNGDRLRYRRARADYSDEIRNVGKDAQCAIEMADGVVNQLRLLRR